MRERYFGKMARIFVIGIDVSGVLTERARQCLMEADELLASQRLFELLKGYDIFSSVVEKIRVMNSVTDTLGYLEQAEGSCAVIASGDPMFYGIGAKIVERLSGSDIEVIPALSSVQLAFSRIGIPWSDAFFMSLHGKRKRQWGLEDLPLLAARHEKLAILTGGGNTPALIAGELPAESTVYVLERLGYEDERVTRGTRDEIEGKEFKDPNIMVVMTQQAGTPVFGLREDEFKHQKGLITKDEVRAVALHSLRLPSRGVFWDVGAGSGSIAIEAKRLCPGLDVYAVERDASRIEDIMNNARCLGSGKINVVSGEAPKALAGLPSPDRAFVGGSGAALPEVLRQVAESVEKGIIVTATITIESLFGAVKILKDLGLPPRVTSLSVSRSHELKGRDYLKAQNQIFLVKVEK
jgi:precorrin-6Y C5,15-methyltransferase (decarboxylating)